MSKQELGGTFTRNDARTTNIKPGVTSEKKRPWWHAPVITVVLVVLSPLIVFGFVARWLWGAVETGWHLCEDLLKS